MKIKLWHAHLFFVLVALPFAQAVDENDFTFVISDAEPQPPGLIQVGYANTPDGDYHLLDTEKNFFHHANGQRVEYYYCALCEPQLNQTVSRHITGNFPTHFETCLRNAKSFSEAVDNTFNVLNTSITSKTDGSSFLGFFYEAPYDYSKTPYFQLLHAGDSSLILQAKHRLLESFSPHHVAVNMSHESSSEELYYLDIENQNDSLQEQKLCLTKKTHTTYFITDYEQRIRTTRGIGHKRFGSSFSSECDAYSKEYDGNERFIILATHAFSKYISPQAAAHIIEKELSHRHIIEIEPGKLAQKLLNTYLEVSQKSDTAVKITAPDVSIIVIIFPQNLWNHRKDDLTYSYCQ